ncbi:MAG: hypothetical protein ABSH51_00035 [Solirubrobacteraceae bacterium]
MAVRIPGALVLGVLAVLALSSSGCGSHSHRRPAVRSTSASASGSTSTAALPPAQAPAQPPPAGEQLGANVNRLFNDGTDTPAQIAAQLAALAGTGATVARSDALWEFSEPAAPVHGVHRYDWAFDDAIAGDLAAHRLTWLPIIDYSALWDESIAGQDHSPPGSTADYAAYAQAFAGRYGAGGTFWSSHPGLPSDPVTTFEIWNEPDNGEFWTPAPDAAAYADLYLAARASIDAADPTARVIVGGLTDPVGFLPAMVAAQPDLVGHIDGVAIHPYGAPETVLSKVANARATLVSLGMASVPLYVTEFGWTTSPPGALDYVAPARRPGDILTTLSALGHLDCGVAAAVLYTWVTPQRAAADSGDWFGIHDPAGGSTPDTTAFATGLRDAKAAGPSAALCGS